MKKVKFIGKSDRFLTHGEDYEFIKESNGNIHVVRGDGHSIRGTDKFEEIQDIVIKIATSNPYTNLVAGNQYEVLSSLGGFIYVLNEKNKKVKYAEKYFKDVPVKRVVVAKPPQPVVKKDSKIYICKYAIDNFEFEKEYRLSDEEPKDNRFLKLIVKGNVVEVLKVRFLEKEVD